jgi:hypothetical protein
VRIRLGIAIETGLHALANTDTYVPVFEKTAQLSPEQFATVLLDFIAGGLGAPSRLAETPNPNTRAFASSPSGDDAREPNPGEEA